MKLTFRCFFVFAFISLVYISAGEAKDFTIKEPPVSLNKYYPPENTVLEFNNLMLQMGYHFRGFFLNLKAGDTVNAKKHGREFISRYSDVAKMVPEWKDYFDLSASKKFSNALNSLNRDAISKSVDSLKKSCKKCHAENRIAVWTKYHWPSFEKILIVDPISEEEVEYQKYMKSIASAMNAISVNFEKGDYKKAKKAFKAFKYRFMELKSTCSKCHTNSVVKEIFFGETVKEAMSKIKATISSPKPDSENFSKNMETLRKESCKFCHLTHMTSTIIKKTWKSNE